jgi:hypothetical protein
MNKIDLIIDALLHTRSTDSPYKVWKKTNEALAAARELNSLEPVAWMYKDGTITSDPDRADGTWTPLYTLDEDDE